MSVAHRHCTKLSVELRKVELLENMRAKEDPAWAANRATCRDTTPGATPMATHITPLLVQMVLTHDDVHNDPELRYARASSMSGNFDRSYVIAARVEAKTHSLGVLLFKWSLPL